MSASSVIPPAAERLRRWLLAQSFAELRPLDVSLELSFSPLGEDTLFVDVVLRTPPRGETWPIGELLDMRRAVRDEALELGLDWPWHVRVRPQTEEPSGGPSDAVPSVRSECDQEGCREPA